MVVYLIPRGWRHYLLFLCFASVALGQPLTSHSTTAPGLTDIFEPAYGGGYVTPDPEDYRDVRGLVEALSDRQSAANSR